MTHSATVARLTIHLTGNAVWHHRPAYAELVHRARREGLAGASVFHGLQGFGGEGHMHRERPGHVGAVGPCAVVIVDEEQWLRAYLLAVGDVLEQATGIAVLDRVEVHPLPAR